MKGSYLWDSLVNNILKTKKRFGQHFLTDKSIAKDIVEALQPYELYDEILEIGPGLGILTDNLLELAPKIIHLCEIDNDLIPALVEKYPMLKSNILNADFLHLDISKLTKAPLAIIGNFPYNISSQIIFHVLKQKECVPILVGMFQKEVAERISAVPGSKKNGILSILIQAHYKAEYLFTVEPDSFSPPPKVKSGVVKLIRHSQPQIQSSPEIFTKVVKDCFQQRRKMLKSVFKRLSVIEGVANKYAHLRAEALGVYEFDEIAMNLFREKMN